MDSAVKAVYNEMIGQTFAVLGMAIAKLSLAIFLLHIVVKQWHRISIWISMISLFIVSLITAIIFWFQRLPSQSIYDPRVPGHIVVQVSPFSVLYGCMFDILFYFYMSSILICNLGWCAAVDFYFALLPWIFIWNLNMKFKKKMSIAISLSLGFMSVTRLVLYEYRLTFSYRVCICGIMRTIDLGGLSSSNYTGKPPPSVPIF